MSNQKLIYKMNFLHRSCCFKQKYASYSQIKYLFTKLRLRGAVRIRSCSMLSHRKVLPFSSKFSKYTVRYFHNNGDDNIEGDLDDTDLNFLSFDEIIQQQSVRNLLYSNSEDALIHKLNNTASIQEVFDFITEHEGSMRHQHVAQAVLILWDIQKIFFYAQQINRTLPDDAEVQNYVSQLTSRPEFHKLLELTERNLEEFDAESLSCILLYLNKMGVSLKHHVLQSLVRKLQNCLKEDISLSALSRFIVTVLAEYNLSSFLIVQDAVPIVIEELAKCESAEDIKLITICLNHFQAVVKNEILEQYKTKVKDLINKGILTSKNYRTLLKIVMFLSYPRWSDKNTILVSEIMLLLKNNLHQLGIFDFFIAYEVLYKNHEPGELLTEIQRCASRMLHHLQEESNLPSDIKLKLLSCIVCFSSPLHRPEYEKVVAKVINDPLTKFSLFDLLKILTFIKPADTKLCEAFWDNALETIKAQEIYKDMDLLLKLSQKYMNYSSDVHYRHAKFEKEMIGWLVDELNNGVVGLIPAKLSMMAAFVLAYENDRKLIDEILHKLAENWQQLNHADCLYISKGVRSVMETTKNPAVTQTHFNLINQTLDKAIGRKLIGMGDTSKINFLVKSCIYRKHFNRELLNNLLSSFEVNQALSSNMIRNIMFSLQATNSLLPDVLDSISDYVINYRDNLLGFNAEKVAYLCYHLGYTPKRSEELFQAITNVILRDQDRISGLSYIQAALSLSFFNKLPDSFIKQIFNVAFLERLDTELATCYFKEIYPIRVRHSMMQLNRAVCLDYPQSSVPWFHQKYIEQLKARATRHKSKEAEISTVKSYFLKIIEDPDYLQEDVNTAYGYHADFVINLDNNSRLLKPDTGNGTKVAIILMRPSAYTNINVQLRGQYQLKKRHLEILGYKVLAVNLNEWNSLVYGEEKLEYLNKLIWPSSSSVQYSVIER